MLRCDIASSLFSPQGRHSSGPIGFLPVIEVAEFRSCSSCRPKDVMTHMSGQQTPLELGEGTPCHTLAHAGIRRRL